MALRPGSRLEISSHFMPLPLNSMIWASSSGDHLLCFLAGLSAVCGGMLRLPPWMLGGATARYGPPITPPALGIDGANGGGAEAYTAVGASPPPPSAPGAAVAVDGGIEADREWLEGEL